MDQLKALDVIWTVFSAFGITGLGILAWALQRHISTTAQNTIQIAVLSANVDRLMNKLEILNTTLVRLESLERDLDHAHHAIRELRQRN